MTSKIAAFALFVSFSGGGLVVACSSPDPRPSGASGAGKGGGTFASGGGSGTGAVAGTTGAPRGGTGAGGASGAGVSPGGGTALGGAGAGASASGGVSGATGPAGGTPGSAGTMTSSAGGAVGMAGGGATGPSGNCKFTVKAQTADKAGANGIPTVGVVDWSVDAATITSASISFGVQGGATTLTAPVDPSAGPNFHTLLLGMKASKTYAFRISVDSCTSEDYTLTTGAAPSALSAVTRSAGPAASSQDKGFIIASSGPGSLTGGLGGGSGAAYAYIIDADGDLVWWAPAPASCSRAKMSVDGQYMWMAELNVDNMAKDGGEIRRVTMDGLTSTGSIPGLANCHHDLTVLPDGKVACLSWIQQSGDQPSDLIESDEKGSIKKILTLDSKVYAGGTGLGGGGTNTYHANALHYHANDDSYTIGDRNPNLFIKVTRAGVLKWQFGGSCSGAPAPQCVAGDWKVNHGHHLLDDGTFLIFNNGQSGASTALFYKLTEGATLSATKTGQY
ncbi:MAG TPA: aryl-sulfate sulfotransferase, partial [Polyangiaceae bacterium]|nr:aryl-sulfate sulfotransferase [Polyangiaceae bacterium]